MGSTLVRVNLRRRDVKGERKIMFGLCIIRIRDSVVGIATGYGLNDRGLGVRVPVGSRIFCSPRRPDLYPTGTGSSFPGVKRPGREADH
jgi:hypothetical protein